MSTMISRPPRSATGGRPGNPIVAVSVTMRRDDGNVDIERVTLIPTVSTEDANEQYVTNVSDFSNQALSINRIGDPDDDYRMTEMEFPGRAVVMVERFG